MHMYTTSIVAKMHKIQFIRKKENIFAWKVHNFELLLIKLFCGSVKIENVKH